MRIITKDEFTLKSATVTSKLMDDLMDEDDFDPMKFLTLSLLFAKFMHEVAEEIFGEDDEVELS